MNTRHWATLARITAASALFAGLGMHVPHAMAQTATAVVPAAGATAQAPDALIRTLTTDVLEAVRRDKAIQAGDSRKIEALVNTQIMPYVNFPRMTADAVGRNWRQATPDQQQRLQQEFKSLLLHTYSGAVAQIRDQSVDVKPLRARPDDAQVIVRTLVRGRGDPIQLDYRLENTPQGWKIYDVNVMGAWLVQSYKTSFSQDVSAVGIEGLITRLVERNKQNAKKRAGG